VGYGPVAKGSVRLYSKKNPGPRARVVGNPCVLVR